MGTKIQPGAFDCYAHAEADEPMFVLLARDPLAADLVVEWARRREHAAIDGGKPIDPAKTMEARACAQNMRAWRAIRSRDPQGPCPESGDSGEGTS